MGNVYQKCNHCHGWRVKKWLKRKLNRTERHRANIEPETQPLHKMRVGWVD